MQKVVGVMGKYIPNKIRCKNCKHFKNFDKGIGICVLRSRMGIAFVKPNMQVEKCFEGRGAE